MKQNNNIRKRSVNSNFLKNRLELNKKRGKINLNKFILEKLKDLNPKSILDLGCGRGMQVEVLNGKFPNAKIVGVDISKESINYVKSLLADKKNISFYSDSIENYLLNNRTKFDLIISSYALYYAKNLKKVESNIKRSLTKNSAFCVVGPYGKNNKELFSLVGYNNISPYVLYTSRDFMMDIVNSMIKNFEQINIATAINPIKYFSIEEVINYWKSSTFFKESLYNSVYKKLKKHFQENNTFIVNKYIMLCLGKNIKK